MPATPSTHVAQRLSLRPGVVLATNDDELRLLRRLIWRPEESFGAPDPVKRALLATLAHRGITRAELLAVGRAEGGTDDDVASFVEALDAGGWLVRTVYFAGRELYTMQPLRRPAEVPDTPVDELVLSRFAILRREDDQILVESPLASARMLVHDTEVTSLIGGLVRPAAARAGDDIHASLPVAVRDRILRDLSAAGLAVLPSRETGRDAALWRPHELWFHARSRTGDGGYSGAGFGRTQWAKPLYEPLPAERDPFPGPAVELFRPDLAELRVRDLPLTAVMEDRRSIRAHDDESPITADQLGELLYRCARMRRSVTPDGTEYRNGPYPAGGGAYEIDLYPVVRRVAGLEQGMYHYDAYEHRLRLVSEPGPQVVRLLRAAVHAAAMSAPPQVLIVLAARFGRLTWTYEELPYSLVLKHVGVLYQTMYLVATSMGLAACGLGAGDSAAFTEATGLDYLVESSVGEFLLGSRLAD